MRQHHLKKLLLALALVAMLFGASGFAMAAHEMPAPCPFAAVMGPDCSAMTSQTARTMHHIDMMLQLSLGTVVPVVMLLAVVLAAALARAWPPPALLGALIAARAASSAHPERYKTASPLRLALFWSALHNRSADPAPARVRGCAMLS